MATEQKVVSIEAGNESMVNSYLDKGWVVKQMIAEHVSVATGNTYATTIKGRIVFLLEKPE